MRPVASRAVVALLVLIGISVFAAPAAPASAADTNDFRFSSMAVDYRLGTDEAGHSTLTTVERLTAEFPQRDQNHGIRRSLVDSYDGHPTGLQVESVTDGSGRPRAFKVDDNGDGNDRGTQVTIAADGFVHGTQVYVITYRQDNVTLQKAASGNDEFYWDVNGTDWPQRFGKVTATVDLTPALARALTGDLAAYQGGEGSRERATIAKVSAWRVTASASNLGPHENLTLAVGFREGTFTPRDSSLLAAPWPLISLAGGLIALLAVLVGIAFRRGPLRDAPGRGTIVAQYAPPSGISLPLAGYLMHRPPTVAQMLALAVGGNLRLVETKKGRKSGYRMEYLTDEGVDDDGRVYLIALFGAPLKAGAERDVTSKSRAAMQRIQGLAAQMPRRAIDAGYRRPSDRRRILSVVVPAVVGGIAAVVFGIVSLATVVGGLWPVLALVVGLLAAITAPILVVRRPVTAAGAEIHEHLTGLREYIHLAEADRLAFLQSPEGAQRSAGSVERDGDEWLHLNESLLPWAALFGEQKRWTAELGQHYDDRGAQPTWYAGQSAFNGAVFSAGVSGFATSTTSAFSSGAGGSTGGGASGGGGGGGGGGGV